MVCGSYLLLLIVDELNIVVTLDTPGLHLDHRMIHMMVPSEIRDVVARAPLRPYIAKTPASIMLEDMESNDDQDLEAFLDRDNEPSAQSTYLWGPAARIDVLNAPMSTHLVFYGSKTLRVQGMPLQTDAHITDESGSQLPEFLSVKARGGLSASKTFSIAPPRYGGMQTVVDLCISGVSGWITIYCKSSIHTIDLCVRTPKGIQVFLRDPFPLNEVDY